MYNTETQAEVSSGQCGAEQLECCEFSPDGKYLAFGSRDNHIYIINDIGADADSPRDTGDIV